MESISGYRSSFTYICFSNNKHIYRIRILSALSIVSRMKWNVNHQIWNAHSPIHVKRCVKTKLDSSFSMLWSVWYFRAVHGSWFNLLWSAIMVLWFSFQRKIDSNHLPATLKTRLGRQTQCEIWNTKWKFSHLDMKKEIEKEEEEKRNHLEVKRQITFSTQSIFYRCYPMRIDSNVYVSIHWEIKYKLLENVQKIYLYICSKLDAQRSTNGAKHRKTRIHQMAPNYYITMGREPNQTVIML